MISDHSEVMSTIQAKISALNHALNEHDYKSARSISIQIGSDMNELWSWLVENAKKN